MILFYNLSLFLLAMNMTDVNASVYNVTGLYGIRYLNQEFCDNGYNGFHNLGTRTRSKITICVKSHNKDRIKEVIEHELKHVYCWNVEGNKGFKNNINHKGCFEKAKVKVG